MPEKIKLSAGCAENLTSCIFANIGVIGLMSLQSLISFLGYASAAYIEN